MGLLSGKKLVEEFDGVRCSICEKGMTMERANFLKELLEHNHFDVKIAEDPPKNVEEGETPPPVVYKVGVTDRSFNAVIAVYQRLLRTKDGRWVTPDYWNQKTDEAEPNYWDLSKKYTDE